MDLQSYKLEDAQLDGRHGGDLTRVIKFQRAEGDVNQPSISVVSVMAALIPL